MSSSSFLKLRVIRIRVIILVDDEAGSQSASASDFRFWKTCTPWLFIFFFHSSFIASCVYVNHWAAELISTIVALFLSFLSSRSSSSSSFAPHDLRLSLEMLLGCKRKEFLPFGPDIPVHPDSRFWMLSYKKSKKERVEEKDVLEYLSFTPSLCK